MQETWVQSLSREVPLEKEMAMHASTLAWKIPWIGGAWEAAVHGVAKSRTRLSDFTFTFTNLHYGVSLVTQTVKNLPAIQET